MTSGFRAEPSWDRFSWNVRTWSRRRTSLIIRALSNSAELILRRAKTHYLTGARSRGGLNVDTGRLRSSISKSSVYQRNKSFWIDIGTNVFYGRIWEEGLMPRVIMPVRGKVLRFAIKGKVVFTKRARHILIRRPFLRPSVTDEERNVKELLRRAGVRFES